MNWYGGGGYKGGHVSSMKPPEQLPSARCMPRTEEKVALDGVAYTHDDLRRIIHERYELATEVTDLRTANGLFQMEAIDYRRRLNRADRHLRLRTSALTRVVAGKRRATKVAQEWALRATNAEVKVAAVEALAQRWRRQGIMRSYEATMRADCGEMLLAALASVGRTEPAPEKPEPKLPDPSRRGW